MKTLDDYLYPTMARYKCSYEFTLVEETDASFIKRVYAIKLLNKCDKLKIEYKVLLPTPINFIKVDFKLNDENS